MRSPTETSERVISSRNQKAPKDQRTQVYQGHGHRRILSRRFDGVFCHTQVSGEGKGGAWECGVLDWWLALGVVGVRVCGACLLCWCAVQFAWELLRCGLLAGLGFVLTVLFQLRVAAGSL